MIACLTAKVLLSCIFLAMVSCDSSFYSKKRLQEKLQQDNPHFICQDREITYLTNSNNWIIRENINDQYNALLIQNKTAPYLKDLSCLQNVRVKYLRLQNTGIMTLNFMAFPNIKNTLQYLWLIDNKNMKDYSDLKLVNLNMLHIENAKSFNDSRLIPTGIETLILIDTGIIKLELSNPETIKTLVIAKNKALKDYTLINQMHNIESLTLSLWTSIDFKNFEKLSSVTFLDSNISEIPPIPNAKLDAVIIVNCDQLKSITNLKNIQIKKLWIIGNNLKRFLKDLRLLNIDELILGDSAINDDVELKGLANKVKKMKINTHLIK